MTRFIKLMYMLVMILFLSCAMNIRELHYPLPAPDHIVVVFFENHTFEQIMNDTSADFIHEISYAPASALFTNSYAMGHPSQPNYLQFISGSNQGVTDNEKPPVYFTSNNLASNLIEMGFTFVSYAEDLPYAGYDGEYHYRYVRKHNPVTNWVGTGKNQVDSLLNQPFTSFPADFDSLPTVSFVIPNLDNDMHDGSIDQGDAWLRNQLGAYYEYTKSNNSLLIITFDEGGYEENGDHILTIFTGMPIMPGIYNDTIDHHIILRTIEDMYNLKHSGNAAFVDPILNCWKD